MIYPKLGVEFQRMMMDDSFENLNNLGGQVFAHVQELNQLIREIQSIGAGVEILTVIGPDAELLQITGRIYLELESGERATYHVTSDADEQKTISVPVVKGDSPAVVAAKINRALKAAGKAGHAIAKKVNAKESP